MSSASSMSRSTTMAAAAGSFLLLDSLRIWLPSFTTIYGSAGTTPDSVFVVFCLAWIVPLVLAVPLAMPRWGRWLPLIAAAVEVAAHILLQAGASDAWQLYASCVASSAGMAWLVAIAVRGWAPRDAAIGFAIALAATTLMNLATGTVDVTWQPAWSGWPILSMAAVLLLGGCWACRDVTGKGGAALWMAAMPALILAGLISTTIGRTWAGIYWPPTWWGGALVGVGAAAGVWAAWRGGLIRGPWLTAVLIMVVTAFADLSRHGEAFPIWIAWPQALLAFVIPATLAHAAQARVAGSAWRGIAAYVGLLVSVLLLIAYYVAFDIVIPIPRPVFVLVIAAMMGIAALSRRSANLVVPPRTLTIGIATLAVLCFATAFIAASMGPEQTDVPARLPLRILTYNIRSGISNGGRFNPDTLAKVIRANNPDVVMLQEVDRGFLLTGGHDSLALLQRRLHMYAYYNPASEPLFGDAILSKWPLQDVQPMTLPTPGVATRPGALSGVLKLGDGRDLTLVVTHMQESTAGVPASEVVDLTHQISRLSNAGHRPLILTGDFNLEPSDARLQPLLAVLRDGLVLARPLFTWPSDKPTMQLDYIFLSKGLQVSAISVPQTTASDHRPVVATFDWQR